MNRSALAATPLLLSLSACLTAGGNIKGDFQCQAPGGTCAPMSSIDAGAVASIGSVRSIADPVVNSPSFPRPLAGPVLADGSAPPRTSDRVLRVVFPAHVDGDGIYREESAAHAVVENAAWAEALGGPARPARGVPALRSSGILPASAPASAVGSVPGSVLATMDEIVAARAPNAKQSIPNDTLASTGTSPTPSLPTPVLDRPLPSAAPLIVGSRSTFPSSLAEVAAGLSAPRVTSLDPRSPAVNYDTPDVTAVRGATASNHLVAGLPTGRATPNAPFGTRPVRWKGKTYQVPYKNAQAASSTAVAAGSAADPTAVPPRASASDWKSRIARGRKQDPQTADKSPSTAPAAGDQTARLNQAALAKVASANTGTRPSPTVYGPTTDAGEAQQRLKAMAAPVLTRAAQDGRAAAREAAPAGFAFPLPAKGTPQ